MGVASRITVSILAALLLSPITAMAAPVFDDGAPASGFQMFPFWKNVMDDMHIAEIATPVADTPCTDERRCAPQAWADFISSLQGLGPYAQMDAVNRWANARPYVDDIANWGLPDYWETPGEFIAHGGDCEDFAIAKYFSLTRLGFSPRDLRIVIVSDSRAHDFHAVLAARIAGTVWLLDNQLPAPVPLAAVPQYSPVYSLNEEGWWLYTSPVIPVADTVAIVAAPLPPPDITPVRLAAK